MSTPTPLRRELLASLGILFGGVTLLLGIALSLVLPFFRSPGEATAFILVIVAVDLVIVLTFGGWALRKNLLEPVDKMARGVKQIDCHAGLAAAEHCGIYQGNAAVSGGDPGAAEGVIACTR